MDVADGRWKFSTGMDLAVRQQGDEVESSAAAESGATAEQRLAARLTFDVNQAVF
jgi:hypothetical protein